MEKTRLGISVGLMGAILYLMGLLNLLGLVVIAGYILFCESNVWLRKSAVKAVVLYVIFALVSIFFGIFDDIFGILNTMLGWISSIRLGFPLRLDDIVQYAVSIIRTILYLALAGLALKQKTIPMGPIDKELDQHLS
ncbi:MAG: hypothetical protein ACOX6P_06210 [Candidatus Merdivicinus sp.]|jgi:hypothetical protein